jgi:hypothetical protein
MWKLIGKCTIAFFERAQLVILAFAIDPFEMVDTSFVRADRSVVLNRDMSSTKKLIPILGIAPPGLSVMIILSPMSNGRRPTIRTIPSIAFAAVGPTAKEAVTKRVDNDTRRDHGFSFKNVKMTNPSLMRGKHEEAKR